MNPFVSKLLVTIARKRLETKESSVTLSKKEIAPVVSNIQVELSHAIKEFIFIIIGVFSAGFGLRGFLLPNQFIDGGATGISLLLRNITSIPLGYLLIIVNIPFLILATKTFNDVLNFDGVILTKLDGDTRGGAALSIKSVVNKPIKFIGTGEKMEAIDVFYPSRMADRILGMGDVVSLVERAQEQFDEVEARKLQKKIAKNQFGFDDFLKQIQQIKKMGNMKDLVGMIPGAGKMMKDVDIDDDAFKGIEAIIHSMTPKERTNPSILDANRKKRIGKGSGTSVQEVNQLLKQFNQMSKMMKMMQGGKGKAMMQAMKNMR